LTTVLVVTSAQANNMVQVRRKIKEDDTAGQKLQIVAFPGRRTILSNY